MNVTERGLLSDVQYALVRNLIHFAGKKIKKIKKIKKYKPYVEYNSINQLKSSYFNGKQARLRVTV
jgi:hypothetical protein